MNIVILDQATLGDDMDFSPFQQEGHLNIFSTTTPDEVTQRVKDAEIIITNKVIISKEVMNAAPNLKLICVAATGYNNIDISEASLRGITVANVKGYSTDSVAQLTFCFILALSNSLIEFDSDVKKGVWNQWHSFSMLTHPFTELKNKTLGIIGYGTIGKRVGEIARVFGMNVIISERKHATSFREGRTDFNNTLATSDYLTFHMPLTDETRNLISEKEFNIMKSTSILINTSRGGVIDEEALYNALKNKRIKAAGVDVLNSEPPRSGSKLFELKNCLVTPHIAWTSHEARTRLIEGLLLNIQKFKQGKINEITVN